MPHAVYVWRTRVAR